MYEVTWTLPTGAAGMAAGYTARAIIKNLTEWTERYGIPHKILQPRTYPYKIYCQLALDKDATWFALTWKGRKYDSIRKV